MNVEHGVDALGWFVFAVAFCFLVTWVTYKLIDAFFSRGPIRFGCPFWFGLGMLLCLIVFIAGAYS